MTKTACFDFSLVLYINCFFLWSLLLRTP